LNQQIELGAAIGTRLLDKPTEALAGQTSYLDTLAALHEVLAPSLYFEVGVRLGRSLSLCKSEAIGVDPNFAVSFPLSAPTRIFKMTSDDFFRDRAADVIKDPIDLAFIDGQHWFEFALRDFINIEKYSTAFSVIVFDDIFPNHPLQAERERQTSYWTGDVWKIVDCLRRYRSDLVIVPVDAHPTGLLLVLNLSPTSSFLSRNYEKIVQSYLKPDLRPNKDVLARAGAVDPRHPQILTALREIRSAREQDIRPGAYRAIERLSQNTSSHSPDPISGIFSLKTLPKDRIAGAVKIIEERSPAIERIPDAIYVPPGPHIPSGGFALVSADGKSVPTSIYLRGGAERPFNQPDSIALPAIEDRVDDLSYFIGPLVTHFGHFTIETISRLWGYRNLAGSNPTLVYHGLDAAEMYARFPHVKAMLAALGIDQTKLRQIDRPTALSDIVVAEPAIQPRRYMYAAAGPFYEEIARRLLDGIEVTQTDQPLYLSKSELHTGVGKILNEYEIEDRLVREGVRIIYPEQMDIVEQVIAINTHSRICGTIGSALHSTLFALQPKKLAYLVPQAKVNSNFLNIDTVKKNRSSFIFCAATAANHSAFFSSWRVAQPQRLAEAVLRELEGSA
jgi:hypothetical protein